MQVRSAVGGALAVLIIAACAPTKPAANASSPGAGTPSATPSSTPSASSTPTATPSAIPAPTPASVGIRLVVMDYVHNQVRLARLDATDTASVTGLFDGVVSDHVIVLSGTDLVALSSVGGVTKLGHLLGQPEWSGPGTVTVSPDLSEWIYTLTDTNWTSQIHLGTPSSDRVIATVASPDGYDFYQPFAWNASGTYMMKEGTGLGGVGPFLEYHFPLARLDLATGSVTPISPQCVGERVLDDGTLLCRGATGGLEVRSPSGATHVIQLSTSTSGGNGIYSRLTLSPDQRHVVAGRNGSSDPNLINFQMVSAGLDSSSASAFGPIDFLPDAWLPDGRIVADHSCWTFQGNGGPCDQSLDGTYFVSADGQSRTLFYKLAQGASVVAYI